MHMVRDKIFIQRVHFAPAHMYFLKNREGLPKPSAIFLALGFLTAVDPTCVGFLTSAVAEPGEVPEPTLGAPGGDKIPGTFGDFPSDI